MAAGEMVLVGCKHPNGVVLNLDRLEKVNDQGQVRMVKGKQTVTLKGWAHPFNRPDPAEGLGGYVLTPVPADFWNAWLESHSDFPMLEDMTILPPHKDAPKQARDFEEVPQMHAPSKQETVLIAKSRLSMKD